jgi:D-3-phosphoglycerate dehydrogenase
MQQTKRFKIGIISPIRHIPGLLETIKSGADVIEAKDFSYSETCSIACICDALFVNPNALGFRIDRDVLRGTPIICVATASTGLDHIDMEYCRSNQIKIISATTEYSVINRVSSTAEHAFGLMLSLLRHIPQSFDSVKKGKWDCNRFRGRQLDQLKIGIIGYGRLGRMFAKYCKAFNSEVYICDPYKTSNEFKNVSLLEMSSICDIMSIHVHLSESTRHLINDSVIDKMNGVYIINSSRGDVVDESSIIKGLTNRKVLGYAADVITAELSGSVLSSPIIRKCSDLNIIVTPHIGGATDDAQYIVYSHIVNQMMEFLL